MDTLAIQAEPNGSDNPYWAFRDPIRRLLSIQRAPQDEMRKQLTDQVDRLAPGLRDRLPLLGDIMHIDVPENATTSAIETRFRPDRTFDALMELFESAISGPMAIIAEDGHWLDEASLDMLQRLGRAAGSRPWTVIVTARPVEQDFEPLGDEVALAPLTDEDIRAIAVETTAGAPLRPHELEAIVARADGSPLFLSEILKMVRETGSADQLPESLDAVVSREIDTLKPLSRQMLRYSAVLGRSFGREVLDRFLEPEEMLLDSATRQELESFIEDDGPTRLHFRHAVVHSAAYEGLSYHRRRALHARAGDVIEGLADDPDTVAEALARHFSSAGRYDKAWRYSRVAADKARHAYANTEAATHYRRAIDAAANLADVNPSDLAGVWTELGEVNDESGQFEAARAALSKASSLTDDPLRVADIQLRRAKTWMGTGDLSQAKRNVTIGKQRIATGASLDHDRALARLYAYEASILGAAGDMRTALEVCRIAIEKARSSGEDEALARALGALDGINYALGRDEQRRGEEAIEIYQKLGQDGRSAQIMNNLGAYEFLDGNWDKAAEWYHKALVSSDRSGDVFYSALTRVNIAEVLVSQRRFEEAAPLLDEARRVYESTNSSVYMPLVDLISARRLLGLGDGEAVVEALERALEDNSNANHAWAEDMQCLLAEAYALSGKPERSLEIVSRLEEGSDGPGLQRVKAIALDGAGESERAGEVLEAALAESVARQDWDQEALILEELSHQARGAGRDPDPAHSARMNELFGRLGIVDAADSPYRQPIPGSSSK